MPSIGIMGGWVFLAWVTSPNLVFLQQQRIIEINSILGVYTTTEDNKDKFDAGVGLIKTTLGVFSMLTNPIVAHTAAEKLSSLPERTRVIVSNIP